MINYYANTTIASVLNLTGNISIISKGTSVLISNNEWSESNTSDTIYTAVNNTTGILVNFGIGTGGINHGVWSGALHDWIIYADNNQTVRIPKTVTVGDKYGTTTTGTKIQSGRIDLSRTTDRCDVNVRCGQHSLLLVANSAGYKGIYDNSRSKWIIYSPSGGKVIIPQDLKCNGFYRESGKAIYKKYKYKSTDYRYAFGNNTEVLRFCSKTTATTSGNTGISFIIGLLVLLVLMEQLIPKLQIFTYVVEQILLVSIFVHIQLTLEHIIRPRM